MGKAPPGTVHHGAGGYCGAEISPRALLPLFQEPYCERCMLVTDDKHPGDLLEGGHIDFIIRKAVAAGVDPIWSIKMAALTPARYFGLTQNGAVAPGYAA